MTVRPLGLSHKPEPASPWLTEQPAATHLGIAPRTLRRWISEGKVRAHRAPSGRLRFRLEDLDAAMTPVPTSGSAA